MKAKKFYLIGKSQRDALFQFLHTIELDGRTKVVVSNAGSKTDKQRGLAWMWYEDVANSGIGGKNEDTKIGVHRVSKWRWAIPILLRDDDIFPEVYAFFIDKHGHDPEKIKRFIDDWIHTESFNSDQMASYLTDFHRYYAAHSVTLSDPDDWKLLQSRGVK